MSLKILEDIQSKARSGLKRIALGDAFDDRMVLAAREATDRSLAHMVLIGDPYLIERTAERSGVSLDGIEIISPGMYEELEKLATHYFKRRKGKVASIKDAMEEAASNDLLFGSLLTGAGMVDGMLAGSLSSTGDVLRAALKGIGIAPKVSVLSSMFLMCFPAIQTIREHEFVLGFGDCAVLPDPNAEQLADVAISTARTYRALTGNEPYVAMLSFSTKGSAVSPSTQKVIEASAIAHAKAPELSIDGELQFDAAFVPDVAARKAKNSTVAGRANVFIFPNLDAGNIGYKLAERLGMGEAIGPVLQGLAHPMNDLSRGAHVSDIVNMIAITSLQAASVETAPIIA
ncbi:MAG TPA: phosphate acetyltransferase [Candidatus Kapabacteria bacterium]|jgi:phosphate acetyltransferase|nr:phosphate acetyltransferase [Candidatus Kapabacteria bacterium]